MTSPIAEVVCPSQRRRKGRSESAPARSRREITPATLALRPVTAHVESPPKSRSRNRIAAVTLVDHGVSVKVKLAGLWAALMLLYVYADILSFYRPGQIAEIEGGEIGPFDVSQSSLVIASLIVIVPTLMIALSLILRASINRPVNLVFGLLFTLVNISNLIGESWVYYFLFGLLEIALTLAIVATAWNWPRSEGRERTRRAS
jgi:hypothetical protein